ncbi:E3 ubiquitin-protein ligase RMND5A [Fragariocoptes setiger]|uniref:E3 ubiquitin-protein ligase RMND5A n=1 Tax=Fragariocoptes setiger TaxID=1670756 RepID=A0ABQ7SBR5_9ACAR|nr:E3 ubiquitin-protein ligase RMND5A [Fragariocoptes setiger]
MEAIASVEKEVDRVLELFERSRRVSNESIDGLIREIDNLKRDLLSNSSDPQTGAKCAAIHQTFRNIRQTCSKVVNHHRDLHKPVGIVGKAIDKNFNSDYGCIADIGAKRNNLDSNAISSNQLESSATNLMNTHRFYHSSSQSHPHGNSNYPIYHNTMSMVNNGHHQMAIHSVLTNAGSYPTGNNLNNLIMINGYDRSYNKTDTNSSTLESEKRELTNGLFDTAQNVEMINQVIIEHFLRNGMIEIADELSREAKLDIPNTQKTQFIELNMILDSLKRRDLGPALMWATKHQEKLHEMGSSLLFKLHRLAIIELLRQGVTKQAEIVYYARNSLQNLGARHEKDIQHLMGALLYLNSGIEQSPYSYLLDDVNWGEIMEIFRRDACSLLGLSVESPLSVTIDAGCVALPALLNINQMMQKQKVTNIWQSRDELPVEIDLGKKLHFHSTFACPILRQQSTESNPPVRLICGHVISQDALHKLTQTTNSSKLKCPYCPVEQGISDAKVIHF